MGRQSSVFAGVSSINTASSLSAPGWSALVASKMKRV